MLKAAEDLYRDILQMTPGKPIAEYTHFNLALILRSSGRVQDAVASYRRVLAIEPQFPEALTNLAEALQFSGNPDQAVECLRKAVELGPSLFIPICNLANALRGGGKLEEAVALYRRALSLEPANGNALNGLGLSLMMQGKLDEAIDVYRKAVVVNPRFADAYHNLGVALAHRGELVEAIGCTRQAVALAPGSRGILASLISQQHSICDWSNLTDLEQQLLAGLVEGAAPFSTFILLNVLSSAADQLTGARNFARTWEKKLEPQTNHAASHKIRVGYLSDHFREHPTAYLMAEVFERHDRSRFEIAAYSFGVDDGGDMRRRLKLAFDRFVDIRERSHEEAASQIRRDEIDILVDLGGYTKDARLEILALRPAPVQVNYLGYPGTMGAQFIDYIIANEYLIPEDSRHYYSERIVRLPNAHLPYDRKKIIGATRTRAAYGLPEGSFVLCCFNQLRKIRPEMFGAWMEIMRAAPMAVLWLLNDNKAAAANLCTEAQRQGVAPRRIIFAPRTDLAQHLARYRVADLVLDTFPYASHTTAMDALWMGCPLATLSGQTFASRVAGSALIVAGLPQLIAETFDEYIRLVKQLMSEPNTLSCLHEDLRLNYESNPLFDTSLFVHHLEAAYQNLSAISLAGLQARDIRIKMEL